MVSKAGSDVHSSLHLVVVLVMCFIDGICFNDGRYNGYLTASMYAPTSSVCFLFWPLTGLERTVSYESFGHATVTITLFLPGKWRVRLKWNVGEGRESVSKEARCPKMVVMLVSLWR